MAQRIHLPQNINRHNSLQQFLLSLIATTISIVLTFGTATWLDNRKKEEAKHEMVMMILYDLASSIDKVQEADSILRVGFEKQLALAAQPELIKDTPFLLLHLTPHLEYTETVERIFSSNIETINTIGNVSFAENVSNLYQMRSQYQQMVCNEFIKEFQEANSGKEYAEAISIDYATYISISSLLLAEMKEKFTECQQMMNVSNGELQTYREKRPDRIQSSVTDSIYQVLLQELSHNELRLQEAIKQGKSH